MKIFITGSTGFVGRNLVEFYSDHEVFDYKRHMNLKESLNDFVPDVIINSAAEIYDADRMWEPNLLMVHECLEYVKEHPTIKMVQIGSSSEYGTMPRASAETDKINPVDMYQATKGAATILCQGYARLYELNINIARPYSVYGKYERPHRLFPRLWRAFKNQEPMKLFHGYHDFIFIDDFIRGIDLLVQKTGEPFGDIVNFGSGKQYSNLEVLQLFEKVTEHSAPVTVIDQMAKAFESDVWICDTRYAKEKYNFEIEYDLEKGIKEFLDTANY